MELVRARWVVTGIAGDQSDHGDHAAEVLDDAAVAHSFGRIVAVGPFEDLRARYPEAGLTHHSRHMLLPGFVNAHHHVGLTPLQLGSLDQPLELWFATRLSARDVDLRLDTLAAAMDMVSSGITCVQHIHPRIAGPLAQVFAGCNTVIEAYRGIGLRVSFNYSVREQNRIVYGDDAAFCAGLPPDIGQPLAAHLRRFALSFEEQMQLYAMLREQHAGEGLTRIQLAPANLHWVTDNGLMAMVERAKADGVPMHMHLLETVYQKEYARRRTGTTAVQHLHRLGALGPSMTLGHAVWLDEKDMDILAHTQTCVCHNCSSNMRLRSGLAPVNALVRRGVTMGLGIDEAGLNDDRDMLVEMKLALRAHRVPGMEEADVPGCAQVLRMATEHGAKTTSFRGDIGRLAPGMFFDAVAIDFHAATRPYQDDGVTPLDALLQRARREHVDTVYVGGDPIYAQGRFKYFDREQVLDQLAEQLARPRSDAERGRQQLARDVLPHVKAFYDGYLSPHAVFHHRFPNLKDLP